MRILLKLHAIKNCVYDLEYFHKLQGFIYNLFKEIGYETKNLLISSPEKEKELEKTFQKIKEKILHEM